jgi:prepilin-type N-terminal cleavage/methylation domain-containing protein
MFGKQNQSGFSIIEVPIALFIIGVMLLIYAAASNTIVLNRNARYQELANRIASSEMEDLHNDGYSGLPVSGNFTHSLLSQLPNSSATLRVSDYNSDTKQVDVNVSWQDAASGRRSVSLTTLIANHGF